MSVKRKLFRDPVHGYIEVDQWFCSTFIDTDIFQRLRFIEQSSMRMLYPGARHDRFIHSLGTFSIAKRIFAVLEESIRERCEQELANQDVGGLLRKFKHTFLVAALLHDCAHAPFSHTGEYVANLYCSEKVESALKDAVVADHSGSTFRTDLGRHGSFHERASAYIACKRFQEQFRDNSIDSEQLARMITGTPNSSTATLENRIFNCLITLVNGGIVDVDRLDYLERDTWATGIKNVSVDIERLITGIRIDFDKGEVVFCQKAVSCLLNAVAARDYFYQWIIPHHKVNYANAILQRALLDLVEAIAKRYGAAECAVGEFLFAPERLLTSDGCNAYGEVVHLPTDGDMLYLMKKYMGDNEFFKAFIERKRMHVALWKTHAEFYRLFHLARSQKSIVCKPDFWKAFHGRVKSICGDAKFSAFCTEPQELRLSRNSLAKVRVIRDVQSNDSLDISYQLPQIGRRLFSMNVYISSEKQNSADDLRKRLQTCFKECVASFRT